MLLYIHVPFCRLRCKYCAFHAQALGRDKKPEQSPYMQRYIDTVCMELALWADTLGKKKVQSIFFGGGTPSLLPPKIVGMLLEKIHAFFSVDSGAEITLEANPESLKGTLAPSQYLSAGINRLSLGVQSFDADMLYLLGRIHKAEESLQAFYAARDAGFVNIGVDLMWGLPGQSVRHWLKTLKEVVRLSPEHISTYGLTLEPGTVLEQEYASGRIQLPVESDQRIMFLEGAAFLEKNGYLQYEISNFARMGYQCRHNLGYWDGEEYLGVGPSATSTLGNSRFTNPISQKEWEEKIHAGICGWEEEKITPQIAVLEMIMLSLRTTRGLSLERYKEATGHDFIADNSKMIQALHENGLIRIRNKYMRLTLHGMIVSNSILSNLFEQTKKALMPQKSASSIA